MTFSSVDELLDRVGGGELGPYARLSTATVLRSAGVSELFLRDIMSAITNVIYTQGVEATGFIGLSELAMFLTSPFVYTTARGNDHAVEKVLQAADCSLTASVASSGTCLRLGTTVTSISRRTSGKFLVQTQPTPTSQDTSDGTAHTEYRELYDAVVLATPLERAPMLDLLDLPAIPRRPFVSVHVAVVTAAGINGSSVAHGSSSARLNVVPNTLVIAPTNSTVAGRDEVWSMHTHHTTHRYN